MGDGGNKGDKEDGFEYVKRSVKGNRRRRKGGNDYVNEDIENLLGHRVEIVNSKKNFLSNGSIGDKMKALFDTALPLDDSLKSTSIPSTILLLGLGNVWTSRASQTQLAFLLLIRDRLKKMRHIDIPIEAYDPIFTREDETLLASFDIQISTENKQGRYHFSEAAFVYMPHCTKTIYENLLRINWSGEGLQRIWLCCNNLERYLHFQHQSSPTPCIDRIVPFLKVSHLPILPSPDDTALNDLAIQRFDKTLSTTLLTDRLQRATTESRDQQHDSKSNFWILPEDCNQNCLDPELL